MNQAAVYVDKYITHIPKRTHVHAHNYGFPKEKEGAPPPPRAYFEEI